MFTNWSGENEVKSVFFFTLIHQTSTLFYVQQYVLHLDFTRVDCFDVVLNRMIKKTSKHIIRSLKIYAGLREKRKRVDKVLKKEIEFF